MKRTIQIYHSPRVEVLEIKHEGVLCGSSTIYDLNYSGTGEAGDINDVIDGGSF